MLNKDFAGATAQIAAANRPEFTPRKTPDLGADFVRAAEAYNKEQKRQALVAALQSGNVNDADAAFADLNPDVAMQQRFNNMAEERRFEQQKELANINNAAALDRARQIALIRAGGNGLVNINMGGETPIDTAQMGIDTLKDIAGRDSIGAWTRFRKGLKLTTGQEERDLGAISSSIAAIAPQAISKLKAAGVSGINTMAEFFTYLGLPENPTSQEIAGALPQISAIIGKSGNVGGQQVQVDYKSKYGLD